MSCLDSGCPGVDIRVDICGVNDSITDRLETQLAAGGGLRGHCEDQGQDWHVRRGHRDSPGRGQSPASSILIAQPPGSSVGGSRAGSTVSRRGCPSSGQSGQKRSQQRCWAGRIQGQVTQSHKVASRRGSGRQEGEPGSTWREPWPWLVLLLKEALLLRLPSTCKERASRRPGRGGRTRASPCGRGRRSLHEGPVTRFPQQGGEGIKARVRGHSEPVVKPALEASTAECLPTSSRLSIQH